MKDVAFPQQAQAQEHLLCVRSDSFEIYAYIPPEFLQNFTKVDADSVSIKGRRLAGRSGANRLLP